MRLRSSTGHRWLLLPLGAGVGFGFGFGMSLLPAPHEAGLFWIGNLCAPWLALAFVSGALQRRWPVALIAGVLVEIACVAGFYFDFLFHGPSALGLPDGTPLSEYLMPTIAHWLHFVTEWLIIGTGAGVVWGLLGHWWRKSAARAAAIAAVLPFLAEPTLWTIRGDQVPITLWTVEMLLGGIALALMFRHRSLADRRQRLTE
jgi:hypothetical protein